VIFAEFGGVAAVLRECVSDPAAAWALAGWLSGAAAYFIEKGC
jgi:hypothetical protein